MDLALNLIMLAVFINNMASQIVPEDLQLNKANTSDTDASFFYFIFNNIVSTKMYNKRDDFDFEIINFPFLNSCIPCSTS